MGRRKKRGKGRSKAQAAPKTKEKKVEVKTSMPAYIGVHFPDWMFQYVLVPLGVLIGGGAMGFWIVEKRFWAIWLGYIVVVIFGFILAAALHNHYVADATPSPANDSAQKQKPEEPTFREKVDKVTFSLGGGGAHIGYNFSSLQESAREPFNFAGFSPVKLYIEEGKLYADVTVFGGSNKPPIKITRNEFEVRPANWDRNSSQAALEIVNENGVPVFQFIYRTPSHIVVNGIFPYPGGLILANEDGMIMNPILPTTFRLKRIFKYPSWKYPGQFEEIE